MTCDNLVISSSNAERVPANPQRGTLLVLEPTLPMTVFNVTTAKISRNKKTNGEKVKITGHFVLASPKDVTQGLVVKIGA